jgi:hypothetical protein
MTGYASIKPRKSFFMMDEKLYRSSENIIKAFSSTDEKARGSQALRTPCEFYAGKINSEEFFDIITSICYVI